MREVYDYCFFNGSLSLGLDCSIYRSSRMKFFETNKRSLQLEWNAVSANDLPKIKKLFIAAYVVAYQGCNISDLAISDEVLRQAEQMNVDPLKLYFEHEFESEIAKIKNQFMPDKFGIKYLTVKFHDQPVAFIVTQLNFKTGRVYVRWNTVSPGFQQQGLGKIMLNEVARYYDNPKLELYTRTLNHASRRFYLSNDMKETDQFYFDEPTPSITGMSGNQIAKYARHWLNGEVFHNTIYPPMDEKVTELKAFVGYCKT